MNNQTNQQDDTQFAAIKLFDVIVNLKNGKDGMSVFVHKHHLKDDFTDKCLDLFKQCQAAVRHHS